MWKSLAWCRGEAAFLGVSPLLSDLFGRSISDAPIMPVPLGDVIFLIIYSIPLLFWLCLVHINRALCYIDTMYSSDLNSIVLNSSLCTVGALSWNQAAKIYTHMSFSAYLFYLFGDLFMWCYLFIICCICVLLFIHFETVFIRSCKYFCLQSTLETHFWSFPMISFCVL